MNTKTYNPQDITEQQHATFERQGWAIFNGSEVEKIDRSDEWSGTGFTPPVLKSDKEARRLAIKQGFIFGEPKTPFTITHVIISN